MQRYALLLLIGLTCIHATCKKRINCKQTIYSFEAFYKAYPDKDSIHVNDTVYFELNAPTQLTELTRNEVVDYSGAVNFGPSIQYGEFTGGDVSDPGVVPAANNFNNVLIEGMEVPSDKPDQVKGFRCIEESGMYKFKLGVVPKKTGNFIISVSNAAGVYTKKNECDKASFNLIFKDTNQHLYLYEQKRPGYVLSDYDRGHLYAFKVY